MKIVHLSKALPAFLILAACALAGVPTVTQPPPPPNQHPYSDTSSINVHATGCDGTDPGTWYTAWLFDDQATTQASGSSKADVNGVFDITFNAPASKWPTGAGLNPWFARVRRSDNNQDFANSTEFEVNPSGGGGGEEEEPPGAP